MFWKKKPEDSSSRPIHLDPPDWAEIARPGELLDRICKDLGCAYYRKREADGSVKLALLFPDDSAVVGHGETTIAAIHDAWQKARLLRGET